MTANTAWLVIDIVGHIRPGADNAQDLGQPGERWAQIWAANGTIQTSDRRDKRDIQPLTERQAGALIDAVAPVSFR